MVKLILEPYCDECPNIEPVADINRMCSEEDTYIHTEITCKYRKRCKNIARHIEKHSHTGDET